MTFFDADKTALHILQCTQLSAGRPGSQVIKIADAEATCKLLGNEILNLHKKDLKKISGTMDVEG